MSDLLAYIDPGSGSLIIQAAIAAAIAIPIFFRTQIARIVHTVRGRGRTSHRPMIEPAPTDAPERAPAPAVERDPGSYRDPGGFIYRRDGVLYRQIGPRSIDDWTAFVASGLAERLIASGRLIGHQEAPLSAAATADARAVIAPEPIEFISYPYEWTFGELKDAALLTLDCQLAALEPAGPSRTPPRTTSSSATASR